LIGAASYAVYLFHLPIIYGIVLKPAMKMGIAFDGGASWFGVVLAVLFSWLFGVGVHKIVELPMQKIITARFARRPS
jgi:peptidoglycan/LPS O-acetylase OafA/YrhL